MFFNLFVKHSTFVKRGRINFMNDECLVYNYWREESMFGINSRLVRLKWDLGRYVTLVQGDSFSGTVFFEKLNVLNWHLTQ